MTKNTTAQEIKNCRCSIYTAVVEEITDADGNMIDIVEDSTGCTATTKNEFAQGHDAKLKSHLIKWGILGYEVARLEGGLRVSNDALGMAREYGFAGMVAEGIRKGTAKREAAQKRADAKHEAQAARQAKKAGKVAPTAMEAVPELVLLDEAPVSRETEPVVEAEAPVADALAERGPQAVSAKVGRWTYDGILNPDGTFTYKAKLGGAKTAPEGTFTVLDA
jgi:hypothetical protein